MKTTGIILSLLVTSLTVALLTKPAADSGDGREEKEESLLPVETLILTHDVRDAPAEIHRFFLDENTRQVIGVPHREFKGKIVGVTMGEGDVGGEAQTEIQLASSAVYLTQTLPIKKSDESQLRRGGDRGRRWGNVSGSVQVIWGQ